MKNITVITTDGNYVASSFTADGDKIILKNVSVGINSIPEKIISFKKIIDVFVE